jgi:hypothetical protein
MPQVYPYFERITALESPHINPVSNREGNSRVKCSMGIGCESSPLTMSFS